jgi:Protein of unknown function (DUF4089)
VEIDLIDEAYVRQAAHGVGLELAPEHVAGVVTYFKMIAGMAAIVNEFSLDEKSEHAAIFTPCSAPD